MKTNAQRNYQVPELLLELYYGLHDEAREVDMLSAVGADNWDYPENRTLMALLANTETQLRKYDYAQREAEYWSEKYDQPHDECNIPAYTVL